MAKRSIIDSSDELEDLMNDDPVITTRLRLLKDVRLKIIGNVTGIEYFFPGGGSELDVDERDAEIMLNKPIKVSCCGGYNSSPYFEIVR